MEKLRVMLADHHPIVREGIRSLLHGNPRIEVVGVASTGRETLLKAVELKPDVLVLEIFMPEGNGVQTTKKIRESVPSIKVLALTMYEERDYLRQMLKAGASGYLLKRTAASELVRAIETVATGEIYIDHALTGQIVGYYVGHGERDHLEHTVDLCERETEVLRMIAWGYSNKEISSQLGISVKTSDTYRRRAMTKMGFSSRAEVVRHALLEGWFCN